MNTDKYQESTATMPRQYGTYAKDRARAIREYRRLRISIITAHRLMSNNRCALDTWFRLADEIAADRETMDTIKYRWNL